MRRISAAFLMSLALPAQEAPNPPELGTIRFTRDLDAALQRARQTGRPVFLLFQEIPGCDTCTSFGADVLSHPLLVEAVEELFVPVVVRNNVDGKEKEILERYREPAWNNPVVRIVGADGMDLIPRQDRVWTAHGIAARLSSVLGAQAPFWLTSCSGDVPGLARAEFAMHCFWEGQVHLGAQPGVVATRAAFRGELETVEVWFDPAEISYEKLVELAAARECASTVFTFDDAQAQAARAKVGDRAKPASGAAKAAPDSDQHYHLRRSPCRFLPLTRIQTECINAALANGAETDPLLSPRQRTLLARITSLLARAPGALDTFALRGEQESLAAYHTRLVSDSIPTDSGGMESDTNPPKSGGMGSDTNPPDRGR